MSDERDSFTLTMFAMSKERIEHLQTQGDAIVEAVITGSLFDGNKANSQSAHKVAAGEKLSALNVF